MRLLVTGGAGFIGANFVHATVRERPDVQVSVLDSLTYAGSRESLAPVAEDVRLIEGDVTDAALVSALVSEADAVVHFAAETHVDNALADHNATLSRLAEFILPAGTRGASQAHVCRTIARRAERAVVALGATATLNDTLRQYLNRLSDLLFVLARVLNRVDGGDDVYWKSERMARAAAAGDEPA